MYVYIDMYMHAYVLSPIDQHEEIDMVRVHIVIEIAYGIPSACLPLYEH